jgi:transposase
MDTITPDLVSEVESARTIGRTSGRSARVEVLARAERRRCWTLEQKRQIVSESLGPELTPTDVARKHGISTGQIYTWRHQLLSFRPAALPQPPQFASVELAPSPAPTPLAPAPSSSAPPRAEGLIEIVLPGGALVRVDAHVDGRALRRVLGALSER